MSPTNERLIWSSIEASRCKSLENRLTFISDGRIIENLRPSTLVGAAFAVTWGVGVLADGAAKGARRATLEVRRSNEAALKLYEKFGFTVAAVRRTYYTHPDEDALVLWRDAPARR